MGTRGRNAEKKVAAVLKLKLHNAKKLFTRAKALRALSEGADPSETVTDATGKTIGLYLDHANKHVRAREQHLLSKSET
jgi:hypothetical protein